MRARMVSLVRIPDIHIHAHARARARPVVDQQGLAKAKETAASLDARLGGMVGVESIGRSAWSMVSGFKGLKLRELGAWVVVFRVRGIGTGGSGCGVQGLGFRVSGLGFMN
jgi:hypothetical protein